MRRPFLPLLVLLAVAASCSIAGAHTGSSGVTQGVTVQLDWYPNPDHVGLYTAIDRGLFARQHLDVTAHQPTDISDPVKYVAASRTDIGISYEPELLFAQQQHAPVVAVATVIPSALNSIIARGGEGIATPAGLRGKTIGVDGSDSTNAYLDAVLRHAGLNPATDVHRVTVGFNLVPALLAHKVDAVIGVYRNIEGAQLAARGVDPVVFPVDRYGVPRYDELVVVANSERLDDDAGYRARVRRFVRGLAAGTAYAKAHPAAAIAVMRRHASRDYRDALALSVRETLPLLGVAAPSAPAWTRFGRWMQSQGLLSSPPDGAALVAQP
jgi:putative hydroxymethylpyrimidine transport system substrate-binding protein